jgi:uncharacterized protein HemY
MNITLILARSLSLFDIIIIAVLIIIAALVIYFLRPLVIAIAIIAAGYFIYRWYTKRKMVRL